MSVSRALREAGESSTIVANLIDGRPWIAASIRNNHLRQHCRTLGRTFLRPTPISNSLKPAMHRLMHAVTSRSSLLMELHPEQFNSTVVFLRVASYSQFWIRSPESWMPASGLSGLEIWNSLRSHLFEKFQVPEFFKSAWLAHGVLCHVERDMYCLAAAGSSLKSTAGLPKSVRATALHHMMQAPSNLTIRQALRWGQARAASCGEALTSEILKSQMVNDLSNDPIWVRLMEKFAASTTVNPQAWSLVVDGLHHIISQEGRRRAVALLCLPLWSLRNHCRKIFENLLRLAQADGSKFTMADLKHSGPRRELSHFSKAVWPGMPSANRISAFEHSDGNGECVWNFRELDSLIKLQVEARVQRHCVASYRKKCQAGKSSIFSLKCSQVEDLETEETTVTIEVNREKREIVQVRGKWNRWPDPYESLVISKWAKLNDLSW